MATLTQLEDKLSMNQSEAQDIIRQLKKNQLRLAELKARPQSWRKYQENTLLQEVLIQAEDIIKIIYFRYHNCNLNINPE